MYHFRQDVRAWLALLAGTMLVAACQPGKPVRVHETRPLMGTVVDITVEGPDGQRLKQAVEASYREMGRLSDMMNHYDPASVVSTINAAAGRRPVAAPAELRAVLAMARRASERSGGAFDITVGSLRGWRFNPTDPQLPTPAQIAAQRPLVDYRQVVLEEGAGTVYLRRAGARIDLGGIAKLYILHAGMEVLARHGVENAMLNGGGDVEVRGTVDGRPWRIGVRDPRAPGELLGVLELTRGFVVSSGDYERYFERDGRRYHHILDPRTGYPSTGPRGVTLVTEDMELVNGLSAAIMVLGADAGRRLIAETPGLAGVIVERDGRVWVSPGLTDRLRSPATGEPVAAAAS
jgi:thiamine biosynthesis lipoprotein